MDVEAPKVETLLDFKGKVVIVTGASGGLGAGIADRFAQAGALVVVHFRTNQPGAEKVVERIQAAGGRAVAIMADLTNSDGANSAIAAGVDAFGRVDVLINNAGSYPKTTLLDMDPREWDDVLNANLRSAFVCTQAFARRIISQRTGGAIVNISSIEAENPAPGHAHYDAAKGGLTQLTKVSAQELAAHNIRCNAVAPGLIEREDILERWPEGVTRWLSAAPLKRLGRPDDVADACLFLASPAARWITGASLTVDGGVMTHQIY